MTPRGKPPVSTIIALLLILVLGVVTVVGAVTVFQLPDPVTEEGKRTELLYQPVLAVSFVVFYGVTAGIIWAIFRYQRKGDELPDQVHGSSVLEATWTFIPIVILVALFIPSVILLLDLKTPPDDEDVDVRVEAIGHQWWWEFAYDPDPATGEVEEGGIAIQEGVPNYADLDPPRIVLPVDQEIIIVVRSADVVHSFSAPHTLYKIQAIPGNVNEMHLTFEETGVFVGQCYQFCGLRHSDMLFVIDVREEDEYAAWVAETQAAQGIIPPDLVAADKD